MSARPNLPNSASESLPSSNMDSTAILSLLEQLDDEIDDLEESLTPILKTALSETTSKLPLLDKAKLYVLVTYAIESILFCKLPLWFILLDAKLSRDLAYLRLHGVKAREHPVYKELTRVRQYFDKIKSAEAPLIENENPSIDKRAAGRFIRAGLVNTVPLTSEDLSVC
jgi:exosome complex protein LRP1